MNEDLTTDATRVTPTAMHITLTPDVIKKTLKTLQSRRLLQGLIKQREIELSCDISTGQYQSSSGLLRYHEFTEYI